jgi:hypothetical protein
VTKLLEKNPITKLKKQITQSIHSKVEDQSALLLKEKPMQFSFIPDKVW